MTKFIPFHYGREENKQSMLAKPNMGEEVKEANKGPEKKVMRKKKNMRKRGRKKGGR